MDSAGPLVAAEEAAAQPLCLRFINTVDWRIGDHPEERLHSYDDLVGWGESVGLLSAGEARGLRAEAAAEPGGARAALEQAIALREALYRIFDAAIRGSGPAEADLAELNAALREGLSRLEIRPRDGGLAWQRSGAERALEGLLWPVAQSAAELLTSPRLGRVRQCADEACGWLFIDGSRNRSRRWCSMKDCGNRAKARRHYRRRRAALSDG